jgi:hypothetical protein
MNVRINGTPPAFYDLLSALHIELEIPSQNLITFYTLTLNAIASKELSCIWICSNFKPNGMSSVKNLWKFVSIGRYKETALFVPVRYVLGSLSREGGVHHKIPRQARQAGRLAGRQGQRRTESAQSARNDPQTTAAAATDPKTKWKERGGGGGEGQ